MSDTMGVVITGGDFQGLAVLRTFARRGIPVVILDNDYCISRFSRFRKKFFKSPPPSEQEAYVDFLIELADKEDLNGWMIIPNSDETVYLLANYKEILKKFYRIPTPQWEVIQNVYIKEKTYRIAEENGIPIPKTYYPKNLEELAALSLEFPAVIKPSIKDHLFSKIKKKAYRIDNRGELLKKYREVCALIDPDEVLVQDFIPGGPAHLYSFCPFFKEGKIITGIMARRKRQHPMDFGNATTFAEIVDIPELKEIAEKFLNLIDYYGIGEVEIMMDPRDGKYKLLEVNPRVWGWHSLAIAAGVDLPYLLYQDMTGEQVKIVPYSNDYCIKWVRLLTDIPTVFFEIIRGKMKLGDYFSSMKGKKEYAVWALDDPLPFLAEIIMLPYLWKRRGF